MLAQEAVGKGLVLTQKAQQQMLGLDIGRAELACLIACEEDYAPCFFGVTFKHCISPSPAIPALADDGRLFQPTSDNSLIQHLGGCTETRIPKKSVLLESDATAAKTGGKDCLIETICCRLAIAGRAAAAQLPRQLDFQFSGPE
jgi:hypothetical protein